MNTRMNKGTHKALYLALGSPFSPIQSPTPNATCLTQVKSEINYLPNDYIKVPEKTPEVDLPPALPIRTTPFSVYYICG